MQEINKADEIRQVEERNDEALVDLILSTEEREEPRLNVGVYCPLCQSETLQIEESAEGDSERVFFQMKCLACGCEFVLFEDDINACRRGIENAERDIKYAQNKIDYFNNIFPIKDNNTNNSTTSKSKFTDSSFPNYSHGKSLTSIHSENFVRNYSESYIFYMFYFFGSKETEPKETADRCFIH